MELMSSFIEKAGRGRKRTCLPWICEYFILDDKTLLAGSSAGRNYPI